MDDSETLRRGRGDTRGASERSWALGRALKETNGLKSRRHVLGDGAANRQVGDDRATGMT